MTSSLRKELNKRYNLLLKVQKSPKGSHQWAAYKKQRNYCTKLLRSAELQYWNNKFTSANSSKEFWKQINSFQGNFKSNTIGPLKDSSGSLLTNNFSKANELNSYFTNVCSTLANTRDIHMQDHSIKSGSHIYRVIPHFLRLHCVYQIANRSINDCKFPNQWKIARVNCIHKKGNTLECGNYRPISLLSIPSKLLESVENGSQLDFFLHDFQLTTNSQWGFTKGKSTELLLLNMTENWRSALNQGKSIGIIFLDFQKAFDCVFLTTFYPRNFEPLSSVMRLINGS